MGMIEKTYVFWGRFLEGNCCRFFPARRLQGCNMDEQNLFVSSGWFNHYIAKMTVDDVFLLLYLQNTG